MSFNKEVIDQDKSITKFIYNDAFVLSLMRKFTKNRELLHLTVTHFASSFISLQCMFQCHFELK
jgi:hypothetical protein